MGQSPANRRQILISGGAIFAALPLGRLSAEQGKLFGLPIPKEIQKIIPSRPLDIARTVEKVLLMEKEADFKKLPASVLDSARKGSLAFASEASLYQLAMPRLVALIDRSELRDMGFADKVGELLAELHSSEHRIPETLLTGEGSSTISSAAFSISPAELPTISRSRTYEALRDEYMQLYNSAAIRPDYADTVSWHLTMLRKYQARYASVSKSTGVPWYFIGVVHALESSFNFRAHLHNGDFPLSSRTRQVPSGRPTKWLPPSDWESSANDALRVLGFTGEADWSLPHTLFRLEAYNGFGYRNYGVATPYLWSFSTNYERGKYVADNKWSTTAKSQQCGAAVMLKALADAGDIAWPEVGN